MAKLKKEHFYYGAMLNALLEYNEDTEPVILSANDDRQVFKVMPNKSSECILFFKYARMKSESLNCSFSFSSDDKRKLREYHEGEYPVLLYFLCIKEELMDSEIIVLKYGEYHQVEKNKTVTFRFEKNKHYVCLCRKGKGDIRIPRNRIEKSFDKLLFESIDKRVELDFGNTLKNMTDSITDDLKCPFCEELLEELSISIETKRMKIIGRKCFNCDEKFVSESQYQILKQSLRKKEVVKELNIMNLKKEKELYDRDTFLSMKEDMVNYKEIEKLGVGDSFCKKIYVTEWINNDTCPVCGWRMRTEILSFGRNIKNTVFFCDKCNKSIASKENYEVLKKQARNNKIVQNLTFEFL